MRVRSPVVLAAVFAVVVGCGYDWSTLAVPPTPGSGKTSPTPEAMAAADKVGDGVWAGTVTGDGQTPWRLRSALGGAHAITIPEGVTLRVSEPHCLPRPSCVSVGEPALLVLTTLLHDPTGSLLVLALELVWTESGRGDAEYVSGELLRLVVPAAGSEAAAQVHAAFDAIVVSLTRVEPPDGLQGYW